MCESVKNSQQTALITATKIRFLIFYFVYQFDYLSSLYLQCKADQFAIIRRDRRIHTLPSLYTCTHIFSLMCVRVVLSHVCVETAASAEKDLQEQKTMVIAKPK